MNHLKYLSILTSIVFLSSCSPVVEEFDANGHFETTEILVAAENPGRLVFFEIEPGIMLEQGQVVGVVDTIALYLKKEQVEAQIHAALTKIPGIIAQKNVIKTEIEGLDFELGRLKRLVSDGAATQKQLDDLVHAKDVALAQLAAFDSQTLAVKAEIMVLEAQINLYNDQLQRSIIKAPIDGLVLERYARQSELVAPGKVLFSIASTSVMELKAYVSGPQLSNIEIGQEVKVRIDWGKDDYREYPGIISWVSGEAEFTPKIIQTKDERVNLVYAIKIRVQNDGKIKIGMPGEVIF